MDATFVSPSMPQLFRDVRGDWRHHQQQAVDGPAPDFHALKRLSNALHEIGELHERAHGCIEAESLQILGHAFHRLVDTPPQLQLLRLPLTANGLDRLPEIPHAAEPPVDTVD